jgi:3-oxoacyl-(acyl-carrier-protein) synthase
MSLRIAGMGWVTPLGRGIAAVWERLLSAEEAVGQKISSTTSEAKYSVFAVPEKDLASLPPHPRLRRASPISRFAAAAGLDAIENARSTIGEIDLQRLALVFAVSNGGVIYTKRFYHDVVKSGAESASPLLFPETVFNAPASHLAAILGITGASYTLVGDAAVGILALKMAEDLMTNDALDYCLVVGAEEADWLLCDACQRWRLLKSEPPIEPFREPPRGMILSEGAGAIFLARQGTVALEQIESGGNFWRRSDAAAVIERILSDLMHKHARLLIASANGTFVDLAERAAIQQKIPNAVVYTCKPAVGESIGASGIWQVIIGAQSLLTRQLPPLLHLDPRDRLAEQSPEVPPAALVLSCGLTHQVAGLKLSI